MKNQSHHNNIAGASMNPSDSNLPLVVIGIVTYNNIATFNNDRQILQDGLNDLVKQTYKNIKIVIQDDCSTDGTIEICEEFARLYSNITFIKNTKNLGVAKNIALLVNKVHGDYFLWGCIDDRFDPTFIEKAVNKLKSDPSKAVCQSYIKVVQPDSVQELIYSDISVPITKAKNDCINQLFYYHDKTIALNPLIHGLMTMIVAKKVINYSPLLYFELSIPLVQLWMGGLTVIDEYLFEHYAKAAFAKRYPKSDYVKKIQSLSFLFRNGFKTLYYFLKLYFLKYLNVGIVDIFRSWRHLMRIYVFMRVNPILNSRIFIKNSAFKFLQKLMPGILYNICLMRSNRD